MEWKFFFRDDGICEIKVKGKFMLHDIRALIRQMISESEWKPGLNKLFDGTGLDDINLDLNDMYNIGKIQQEYEEEIGGGRLAILVKDTVDYGTGLSYKETVDEDIVSRVKIFLKYDQAIEWLLYPS